MNQEYEEIIELRIRRYMSELVEEHLPKIIHAAILAHNSDVDAHSRQIATEVDSRFNKLKFLLMGLTFGLGVAGGAGLSRLIAAL